MTNIKASPQDINGPDIESTHMPVNHGFITEDWPVIQSCNITTTLTDEERHTIDHTTNGEHPPQDQYPCELVAQHRSPHHALAQLANGQETWLTWDNTGLRELRNYNSCPLEIPLAQKHLRATTTCNLFDGHEGPHPCGDDLWWYGN